jgi:hypothetical protein
MMSMLLYNGTTVFRKEKKRNGRKTINVTSVQEVKKKRRETMYIFYC